MRLFEEGMEKCVLMDRRTISDGMGGYSQVWTEGAEFDAAVVKDNTLNARVAEKEGVTELYTVTVYKTVPLQFHDVFKRISNGDIFRVTSNITDSQTPNRASFQIGQVIAEKWVLPS